MRNKLNLTIYYTQKQAKAIPKDKVIASVTQIVLEYLSSIEASNLAIMVKQAPLR